MNSKKIKIIEDGPYLVLGQVPTVENKIEIDECGNSIAWNACGEHINKDAYCLCRCGHSENKPYCDGAHSKKDFCGEESAPCSGYKERAELVKGETLDMLDEIALCAYARFCDVGPEVWGAVEKSDIEENRKIAMGQVANCISGRLTLRDKEGKDLEVVLPQEISPTIDTAEKMMGPLWVKGGIEIEGANGKNYEKRNRVALCRCGESDNKPFCDGNHLECTHMNIESK